MRLSVIVPAYNEGKRLAASVHDFLRYLKEQDYDWELIIINDGSKDATAKIAAVLAGLEPRIKVITLGTNQGKGAAVRTGLMAARGDFRLFLDADNATAIDHISLAWPLFQKGYGLVIGSRHPKDVSGSAIARAQPVWKQLLGKAGNMAIRWLAIPDIRDTQCGFKIMTKELAEKIIPLTGSRRWALDVELIALARRSGYGVGIIPVRWSHSGESTVGIAGYFQMLWELILFKFNNFR